jgi:hypothetical protein
LAVSTALEKGHIKVTFDMGALPSDNDGVAIALQKSNINTWYLWPAHVQVNGTETGNKPNDVPSTRAAVANAVNPAAVAPPDSQYAFNFSLSGLKGTYSMANSIVGNGRMKWYEALHYDPATKKYRVPENSGVVNNIIALATFDRDKLRPHLAKKFGTTPDKVAIIVNSWYRDPVTNRNVGGASQSRHLTGDALDFVVRIDGRDIHPHDINAALETLMSSGGLASASIFTHIDVDRGYRARWSYGY